MHVGGLIAQKTAGRHMPIGGLIISVNKLYFGWMPKSKNSLVLLRIRLTKPP